MRLIGTVREGLATDYWRDSGEPEDMATSLEYVALQVENGTTVAEISEQISAAGGIDVTRAEVMRYLSARNSVETVTKRLAHARSVAANAYSERAQLIAEEGVIDKLDAMSKTLHVRTLLALATRYDASKAATSPSVAISFRDLHLHALRERAQQPLLPAHTSADLTQHITVDAEVLDS